MPELQLYRLGSPSRWQRALEYVRRSITLGPWNPKDPAIARYFSGSARASGIPVSEENSLSYSAVWGAVNLIAGDVAKVPLTLYRTLENGGKEAFRTHPLYELMHDEPNPEMSSFVFRRTLQGHVLVWGNGYAEIERDGMGRAVALWPLMPYAVLPHRERGVLRYRVTQPDGAELVFDRRDILHLSGLGQDGIIGYPPIRKAMESIGLGMATERFGATFFGNGATFGGIVKFPQGAAGNPQAREDFKKMIEGRHQGVDRAHRLLTLYDGGEYQQLGVPPDAAQFLETRRFQIEEVARWFNLPVHKLKELARSTNNNIEHQSIEYATDTLQPWFRMWEGELRLKVVPRLERKQQFFEHITEALTRGDSAAQGALVQQQFNVGGISPNEIRAKFNYNPRPDGDDIYVPSQTMPARLAIQYWEAQIDAAKAKAEADRRPPPVAPVSTEKDDEIKALRDELALARRKAQDAEDIADREKVTHAECRALLVNEEQAHEQTGRAFNQAIQERDDLVRQTATLQEQLTAAAADGGRVAGDLHSARTALDAERLRSEELGRSTVALAAERDRLIASEQSIRTERDMLSTDIDTLQQDIDTLKAERDAVRAQRIVAVAAMRGLFVDAAERLLQREADRARKAQATPEKLRAWVGTFYPLHADVVRDAFRPAIQTWAALTGADEAETLAELVTRHVEQSTQAIRQVADVDDPDQMAAALERTLRRWETERAGALADALLREGMQHG